MKNREFEKAVVLIPARMASTRLPGKPLADIGGKPMIVQVALRAREAGATRIVVAVDDEQVFSAVKNAGFDVMMTRDDHQSGSDRIFEALQKADPYGNAEYIINVQGDLPTIEAETIRASLRPLENAAVDIATLTVEITDEEEKTNPNVVKVVGSPLSETRLRALYFTRATAPYGDGPLYHHIGLYTYRRAALETFVRLQPSPLEKRERLEQLRALEAGMRIDAEIVHSVPLGVDTPHDLEKARTILANRTL
ncbi:MULTISPECIES: 3-deoxy-manno-octulosonate cytidylyltransferase [Rhizobium/Agrobacterium group]|jgi:3-deoxy-manno-octulosonate cytidylyltransferase (CMP-KDO synthetase)|uniref:3-deoxy-manno-octulosonate cytidylyltransferase n=1 Tax=Rhizobium/Agrobacterium group TaxID=227290 RepID=UPI0003F1D3BB|nr:MULTISPECIES: 3-deoxy-manno-octulosonate cytidylyltransferase [Rhizobium/Agrobacterium group]AHJ99999.1 3-deoxy-manno-octulosonate cytidylyltransferase [Agrobacterium tumefaciens LBA4213 (Ach5)]AKC05872.1 3-deoxy-manno-octulosonate cytidylyltransferase [Agrobacterium tumefaciens]HCV71447.1 3-deoxy-manno-octulosonate cytidylyltransferase [Agrobacterium sp.]AYM17424.1 3-deoxy-manno-octulosonate cytidylyltransferase [Agrobacterium tumefaciens]AYM68723.1 3-deoxy-manno-octulosonate cytidylyltran